MTPPPFWRARIRAHRAARCRLCCHWFVPGKRMHVVCSDGCRDTEKALKQWHARRPLSLGFCGCERPGCRDVFIAVTHAGPAWVVKRFCSERCQRRDHERRRREQREAEAA